MPSAVLATHDRQRIKTLIFDHYDDWSCVLGAVKERRLTISRTALERFFNGSSGSRRTLRCVAALLHTTPDALLNHTHSATPPAPAARAVQPLSDPESFRLAYQFWIEMTTRKLGLPIDLRHDIVAELYDSWYAFFKLARELVKAIPLHRNPASQEMRHLVGLFRAVLNEGMRPHLEHWQARFRAWLSAGGNRALAAGLTPQEMQSQFPEWTALSRDLMAANRRLGGYLTSLEAMVAQPRKTRRRENRSRSV